MATQPFIGQPAPGAVPASGGESRAKSNPPIALFTALGAGAGGGIVVATARSALAVLVGVLVMLVVLAYLAIRGFLAIDRWHLERPSRQRRRAAAHAGPVIRPVATATRSSPSTPAGRPASVSGAATTGPRAVAARETTARPPQGSRRRPISPAAQPVVHHEVDPLIPKDARPGWVYRDGAGTYVMAIDSPLGLRLAGLPGFDLVDPTTLVPPLSVTGGAELNVLPLTHTDPGRD